MKFGRYIFVAIAIMMLTATTCFADGMTVVKDRIKGSYIVDGTISGTEYRNDITFVVTDGSDNIVFADYSIVENGAFRAELRFPKTLSSGEYTLYAGSYDRTEALFEPLMHTSAIDKARAIADICAAMEEGRSKTDVVALIENKSDTLELLNSTKSPLIPVKLADVYGSLYDVLLADGISDDVNNYISTNDITEDLSAFTDFIIDNNGVENFLVSYYKCMAVHAIKNSTKEMAPEVIAEFREFYGFDSQVCYPVTNNQGFNAGNLAKRLTGKNYTSMQELYTVYNEQVFLQAIESATDYNAVIRLFRDYAATVGITMTSYNKLGESTSAVKLVTQGFDALSDIETYLKTFIEEPQNGGGGGGGAADGGESFAEEVTEEKPSQQYNKFNDLSGAVWAAEAIEYLAEKGIISGYEDGSFRPGENLTREAFTKMIIDAKGMLNKTAKCNYSDITETFWGYSYIASAKENGIIYGISAEKFGTGLPVSRQDMAVILARAGALSTESNDCEFADFDSVSDYAKSSVAIMKQKGIINGFEDRTFRPHDGATRAEAAKMIYDMLMGGLL